jgi:hypothetical protein
VAIEVTAYEPDVRFGLEVAESIRAEQTFSIEAGAEGTRLTVSLELAAPQLAEPARPRWDGALRTRRRLLESER